MRPLIALCLMSASLPLAAHADDLVLNAPVTSVELYPDGAQVTRQVTLDVTAGDHRLILPQMSRDIWTDSLQLSVTGGARLGPATLAPQDLSLYAPEEPADVQAARSALADAKQALAQVESDRATALAKADAARAQAAYAGSLDQGQGDSPAPDALRDIAALIGETVTAARIAEAQAEADAARFDQALDDARKAVKRAQARLDALTPEGEGGTQLTAALVADAAGTVDLTVRYHVYSAGWQPVYELFLDRGDAPELRIARGASIIQNTGESWNNVALTLSTLSPGNQVAATEPFPWLRRIAAPSARQAPTVQFDKRAQGLALESPIVAEAATSDFAASAVQMGLNVTYDYPQPVTVPSGDNVTRLSLDSLAFDAPKVIALAVPLNGPTAFVQASFTNDSGEAILPGEAVFYLDGVLTGRSFLPMIAAGEETELGFGEIRGLQLERIIADRLEGDRGIISRSNEETEEVQLKVTNLTGEAWDVRMLDRVPYSEQEDLKITWQAVPQPTETDVDGQRGILAWERTLDPGQEWQVKLSHRISWPEGQELQ